MFFPQEKRYRNSYFLLYFPVVNPSHDLIPSRVWQSRSYAFEFVVEQKKIQYFLSEELISLFLFVRLFLKRCRCVPAEKPLHVNIFTSRWDGEKNSGKVRLGETCTCLIACTMSVKERYANTWRCQNVHCCMFSCCLSLCTGSIALLRKPSALACCYQMQKKPE